MSMSCLHRPPRRVHGVGLLSCALSCALLLALTAGCARQTPTPASPDAATAQAPAVAPAAPAPAPSNTTALLLLPLTGPYGPFAVKIQDGAEIARKRLASEGVTMELLVVDTNSPEWRSGDIALPERAQLVGGPMRPEVLSAALATPAVARGRVFFSFMAELPESPGLVEGRDAWRFFTSPRDPVATLLDAATQALDLNDFAVMYPEEDFGRRRAELFLREASARSALVEASVSYPPEDPLAWDASVARLLTTAHNAPHPESAAAGVQAVYIPDIWSQARMLVPHFHYQRQGDLVILGSSLWAQTMTLQSEDEARLFRLALFPGSWWKENPSPEAQALRQAFRTLGRGEVEFWNALGHDFVMLASRLNLPPNASPAVVNARLREAQRMAWAMAPLRWNEAGKARQELFLLTPTLQGARQVELERFAAQLREAKRRAGDAAAAGPQAMPQSTAPSRTQP